MRAWGWLLCDSVGVVNAAEGTEVAAAIEFALCERAEREGLWDMKLRDVDLSVMAEEATEALPTWQAIGLAVCKRMLYGWHPSVTHRQWFRTTTTEGEVREVMSDEEAAFIDEAYSHA